MPASVRANRAGVKAAQWWKKTACMAKSAVETLKPALRAGAGVCRSGAFWKGTISLALAGSFFGGLAGAEEYLRNSAEFDMDPRCLQVRISPPWLAQDWTSTIPAFYGERRKANLFDPGLAAAVMQAYEKSPWIESVSHVRKEFPDRLKVGLRIRTPLAAVPCSGGYLLVDGHGVLLPREFQTLPQLDFPLRVIEGVSEPRPSEGEKWESRGLDAGLAVAAALIGAGNRSLERITRIDVSRVNGSDSPERTEVVLFTAEGGGPIEWGYAPGAGALDIPFERKIGHLELLLATIPDMHRVRYATIQFDDVTYAPLE